MSNSIRLQDYAPYVGDEVIRQCRLLARRLGGARIQHISSTRTGGGVAEILSRLVPLMDDVGLDVDWTVIDGSDEFFEVTKTFHNALHGAPASISPDMFKIYRRTTSENLSKVRGDVDFIIVHDPQPLGLVEVRNGHPAHWIWRCHIDVAQADQRVWAFLKPYIDRFDAAIFHIPQFLRQDLIVPQYIISPFIDPYSDKNRELSQDVIQGVLERFGIPQDKPFVLQASRFDRLKDPLGSLRAYQTVRRTVDINFVFVGNFAPDDPEGAEVSGELVQAAKSVPGTYVIVNPDDNDITVNALQRAAAVVLQKSIREGFGLSVTEAMWKAKPVIGGDTGGIAYQIIDGVNGFLVRTVEGAAYRLRQVLSNPPLAQLTGQEANRRVRTTFLPPYYLRSWLCVLLSFVHASRGVTVLTE